MDGPTVVLDCTLPATVAILRHRNGHVVPLLFDGGLELASGVYVGRDGRTLTGRAALDAATADPDRYWASPLELIGVDSHPDTDVDAAAVVAALLARVREQANQLSGTPVSRALVVVPPGWGPRRRTRLRNAAHQAGLTDIDTVDAATALASQVSGQDRTHVLVCRVAGAGFDVSVVRRTPTASEVAATIEGWALSRLDAEASARVAEVAAQAVAAADLTSGDITAIVLAARTTEVPGIAAALRQDGLSAPVRTVGNLNSVYGALTAHTRPTAAGRPAWGQPRDAVAAVVPLVGAAVLQWLLLQSGATRITRVTDPTASRFVHLWPVWSMVAILVFLGVVALVLSSADRRARSSTQDSDRIRRRQLARGLKVAAAVAVATGVVSTMLGATTYTRTTAVTLLVWTTLPVLVLGAGAVLMSVLIERGDTSAVRWQIWLRLPNTTAVLAVGGLVAIESYRYGTLSVYATGDGLPDLVDQFGSIAVALALLPLTLRRVEHQLIASPFVIIAVVCSYGISSGFIITGALLTATVVWWLTRIGPAGAYANPNHPATILATALEPPMRPAEPTTKA